MQQNSMTIEQYEDKYKELFVQAMCSKEISYLDLIEVHHRSMMSLIHVIQKEKRGDNGTDK